VSDWFVSGMLGFLFQVSASELVWSVFSDVPRPLFLRKVQCPLQAVFTSHANPKYFLFHPSHRIFRRMHETLNIGKKDN
jgi:hypothetical protein